MTDATETPATGDAGAGSPDEGETVHQANARLRYEWLEATFRRNEALEAGDDAEAERWQQVREDKVREFFTANRGLVSAAKEFFSNAPGDLANDYVAAAQLALWEAFAGTEPELIDQVTRRDDGSYVGASGWDPTKGAFSTYSRTFVRGKVQRAVASSETNMSYGRWTQRPAVLEAQRELTKRNGVEPTHAEIAKHTGMTLDAVRTVLAPTPVSIHATVGEDMTLEDVLADKQVASAGLADDMVEDLVAEAAQHVRATDLFSFLLRRGPFDADPVPVVDAAARLGLGRGTVLAGAGRVTEELAVAAFLSPRYGNLVSADAAAGSLKGSLDRAEWQVKNGDPDDPATGQARERARQLRQILATLTDGWDADRCATAGVSSFLLAQLRQQRTETLERLADLRAVRRESVAEVRDLNKQRRAHKADAETSRQLDAQLAYAEQAIAKLDEDIEQIQAAKADLDAQMAEVSAADRRHRARPAQTRTAQTRAAQAVAAG